MIVRGARRPGGSRSGSRDPGLDSPRGRMYFLQREAQWAQGGGPERDETAFVPRKLHGELAGAARRQRDQRGCTPQDLSRPWIDQGGAGGQGDHPDPADHWRGSAPVSGRGGRHGAPGGFPMGGPLRSSFVRAAEPPRPHGNERAHQNQRQCDGPVPPTRGLPMRRQGRDLLGLPVSIAGYGLGLSAVVVGRDRRRRRGRRRRWRQRGR